AEQWSARRLAQDWRQPAVEALRHAEPVPAEQLAQGLEFASARPGAVHAAIAAGGGERPGHVHLASVVGALTDSAGYIEHQVQDLMLEMSGGAVLARGMGRRTDELRDPAV
ncbi:unnamed protein product, partial [Prorocentrum cordatum]